MYAHHESEEQRFREFIGKDVSILTETKAGIKSPLTLRVLRERIEAKQAIPCDEWGGCGCAIETPEQDDAAPPRRGNAG